MSDRRETSHAKRSAFAVGLIGLFIALFSASCGKSPPTPPQQVQKQPAASAPTTRSAAPKDAEFDKLMSAVDKEISAEDARLEKQADDLMREHPDMNAQQLLNLPEVNECLRDFLQKLSQSPELQKRVNSAVTFTAEMKDLRENREQLNFAMDVTKYGQDRTRRLLTSLLSRNPNRVLDFFEKETGEAAAEFALDPSAPKSLNGITVERKAPPPPAQ